MSLQRSELEAAYERLETPLYNFALRYVWNPQLAQELVQDTFMRAWQSRASIDPATFKSWLYKTTQNLAFDEHRRAKVRRAAPALGWLLGEARTSPSAEAEFLAREMLTGVYAALKAMPSDLRETFLMCQFSDMTYEEVAAALGIASGTVASRKNRAILFIERFSADSAFEVF